MFPISMHLALLAFLFPHSLAQQVIFQEPSAHPSPSAPYGPLPWGELNVIHTTDTHGFVSFSSALSLGSGYSSWLRGHLGASTPEPNYSGEYLSVPVLCRF